MKRYSQNILQWNKNDKKSTKMTTGDYCFSKWNRLGNTGIEPEQLILCSVSGMIIFCFFQKAPSILIESLTNNRRQAQIHSTFVHVSWKQALSSILMLFYYLAPLQNDSIVMSRCMQFPFGDERERFSCWTRMSYLWLKKKVYESEKEASALG